MYIAHIDQISQAAANNVRRYHTNKGTLLGVDDASGAFDVPCNKKGGGVIRFVPDGDGNVRQIRTYETLSDSCFGAAGAQWVNRVPKQFIN
jgi:hypothetical protein